MIGQEWVIRWLHQPLWLRLSSLTLSSGLLVLALCYFGLRPVQTQADALTRQHQQQQERYQATLRTLLYQPSLQSIETDIARLQQALLPENPQAFSLPGLIADAAGQLEVWQPVSNGGELTMRLRWQGFQAALHYLSRLQSGIELPQFTLRAAEGQLRFTSVLVLNHEI